MKNCKKCNEIKPTNDFGVDNTKKDKLQTYCRECNRKQALAYYYNKTTQGKLLYQNRAREHRLKIRDFLYEIKGRYGCYFCQENYPLCLDFHHINANTKKFEVNSNSSKKSIEDYINEIKKCEIVCANCHRKVHANELIVSNPRQFNVDKFLEWSNTKHTRSKKRI